MPALQGVSRETEARLATLASLLRKWSPRINLVSRTTLDDLEHRHIADSAQLFALRPPTARHWADLGSGGGFPGLVIAILAAEQAPDLTVTLVESDRRKAAFLATAARACTITPRIIPTRIESLPPLGADVLSARALAPLPRLLELAAPHIAETGIALFPKGAGHAQEIDTALASWRFSVQKLPSQTDPDGTLLLLRGIARA